MKNILSLYDILTCKLHYNLNNLNVAKYIRSFFWPFLEEQIYSPINGELYVFYMYGRYRLYAAHTNYSFGELHQGFRRIFKRNKLKELPLKSVLILGFGVGSVSTIIREEFKMPASITAIEYDPIILQLGSKYFNIDRFKDHQVILDDASAYVKACKQKFDLIVFDVYQDDEIPADLEKVEFLQNLKACLAPGGKLFWNKDVNGQNMKKKLLDFESRFMKVFPEAEKQYNLKDNYFYIYNLDSGL